MTKTSKKPPLRTEDEEREFWHSHNSTEFVNWSSAKRVTLANLKPSVKTISLRLPQSMLHELKRIANKRDIPYQSLIKLFLAERLKDEIKKDAA